MAEPSPSKLARYNQLWPSQIRKVASLSAQALSPDSCTFVRPHGNALSRQRDDLAALLEIDPVHRHLSTTPCERHFACAFLVNRSCWLEANLVFLRPQPVLCPESWWSSFHSPPSFTRIQTMWNRPVSVLFRVLKSTVAVAVFPLTSFTSKELMVVLSIWDDSSPAIQFASSCWLLRVGPK